MSEIAKVVVFSSPTCQPCRLTKKTLTEIGIEFIEKDISTDEDARGFVMDVLHYGSAPVVIVSNGDHWSGLIPEKLGELKALHDNGLLPEPTIEDWWLN
ncbi:glutaredoxin [Rhodococcus phage BobbyDazzler]|uniref:Glutaredoxin n=1 Tax=Rhodococcus phage Hiro TaxID=2015828 RepID=A0A222ZJM1_9CAUD|nr:thioredoxin domain [Rhodococcus phage Hiro]AOT23614.1 glutaredoxin [Rhodococcus phage Harlequin]AQP30973.1 glutaredoxin [Rhodococcus phage BobbyDazzler]ASJ78848.1 glutaredoxin [Rhodococcus phage Jester]ASR80824.1 glutaredoxin [Rhodococcus phage Yoncess]AWY04646.1 glutaredoxin [Rhodococcus phage Bryce]